MNFEFLKQTCSNKSCFIFGNSPNVLDYDLSKFNNEFIITVNKGYLLWNNGLRKSDIHVITDHIVFKSIYKDVEKLPISVLKIFNRKTVKTDEFKKHSDIKNIIWYNEPNNVNLLYKDVFPKSLEEGWKQTWNVVSDAIIISYFLGFKNIYILGMDFDYLNTSQTHFYGTGEIEKTLLTKDIQLNNFNKKLRILKNINNFFKKNNVNLYNCSKKWKHTDIISYIDIEDVL